MADNTTQREYRFTPAKELRINEANGRRTLTGYAAVFNSLSGDLGGFKETINRGAFSRSLNSNPDVVALSEHDSKKGILGRTKSGTLRLNEDSVGLRFECDLPTTQLGNDIATSVARGDLDACSFGFVANDSSWAETGDGVVRSLKDVSLFDVSVVANPAYPATSVQLRSLQFPDGPPEVPVFQTEQPPKEGRALDTSDMPDCSCDCPQCNADDCMNCSLADCVDAYCSCQGYRSDLLLAMVLERRMRWAC
jgi:hypothetical protein